MTAAYQQYVKTQLAIAKRDYAPGSEQLKAAELAYVNAGGIATDVAPAAPDVTLTPVETSELLVKEPTQLEDGGAAYAEKATTADLAPSPLADVPVEQLKETLTKIETFEATQNPTEEQLEATKVAVQDDPRFEPVKLTDGTEAFVVKEGLDDPMEDSPEAVEFTKTQV